MTLAGLTQRSKTAQALALRARIVLPCAEVQADTEVAERLQINRHTVGNWRRLFLAKRLDGLFDEPRPGAVAIPRAARRSPARLRALQLVELRLPADLLHALRLVVALHQGTIGGTMWSTITLANSIASGPHG
jgi:transposase-like protein